MNDIGLKDFRLSVNIRIRFLRIFSFLETRQDNRQHYESYVCRRILGKQAVVILSCDNRHMNHMMSKQTITNRRSTTSDFRFILVTEPGLVIIFSHGVK